jgi:hypothetical protein
MQFFECFLLGIYRHPNSQFPDLAVRVAYLVIFMIIAFGAPVRWPHCHHSTLPQMCKRPILSYQ